MNIQDLFSVTSCPICNAPIEPHHNVFRCPNKHYAYESETQQIRFFFNVNATCQLVCYFTEELLIYNNFDPEDQTDVKSFNISTSNSLINNSSNIKDLQTKLTNLYFSAFS